MSSIQAEPTLPFILEEHLEELEFLWELREGVVAALDYSLDELEELEDRADAHRDGLRIGGSASLEISRPWLTGGLASEATAAAFVFLDSDELDSLNESMQAFEESEVATRDGIRLAMRHSSLAPIHQKMLAFASHSDSAVRAAACDVLAFHRATPVGGVEELLSDPDEGIRVLAWSALGRWGGANSTRHLDEALAGDSQHVRRAAIEAFARSGQATVLERCRTASSSSTPVPDALYFLGVLGDLSIQPILESALRNADVAAAALSGLGALGSVSAIPVILEAMKDQEVALAAGQAFQRITGAEDVDAERDEEEAPGSGDEPGSAETGDAIEDQVEFEDEFKDESPLPDFEKATHWWHDNAARFTTDRRWQMGIDVTQDVVGPESELMPLGVRRDRYLRARLRVAGSLDFEAERRVCLQRQSL